MGVDRRRREPRPGRARLSRRRIVAIGVALTLVALWCLAGLQRLDPDETLAVVDCLGGRFVSPVDSTRALAPPGLCRLVRYERAARRVLLPNASQARLPAADGGRWGLLGWSTLEPRAGALTELHAAARDAGLEGALGAALAEASSAVRIERRGPERRVLGPTEVDRLHAALEAALARRGLSLLALDVDSVDFLTAEGLAARAPPPDATRVLLIGLDGADWQILDPLIDAGRLPTLAGLIERGVRGRLLTISPMLSPVIWTSMATGVEPTRHGILDFLVAGADGTPQPVTASQRRVPALWELLSDAGVDVGVVGWWATWPAVPVRGYLVSDRLAYQLFGYRADPADALGKTWPPDLYEQVRPRVADPHDVGEARIASVLGTSPGALRGIDLQARELIDGLRTLLASGDTYVDVASALSASHDPRFETLYLEGTDTIGHLFMRFRPPTLPGVDPAHAALFGAAVDRYYEIVDAQLGRLLEGRDESWTVLVVSDHGFASDATRPRTADPRIGHGAAAEWHRRFGVVIVSGANVRAGGRIEEASIYDVAPTVLSLFGQPVPRDWPGRVLAEAIDPAFLDRHPVHYDDRTPALRAAARAAVDDPNAADLMSKLESLGYVAAGGSGAAVTAVNNAAVALMGQGRHAEAEAEFRRGLRSSPGSTMLEMNLGLCLMLQGRSAEAATSFERVLERGPGPSRAVAAVQLARLRFGAGRHDDATRLIDDVLAGEPDAADALTLRGELAESRGAFDEAERDWRRAAIVDPDAAASRNHLGTLMRARGNAAEAERWYLESIAADPYFMGAYNNLALVYQASGRLEQASDLYRRALVKAPEHPAVLNNLASLQLATGRTARAAELWRRAAAADPTYASPLSNLASIAISGGRLDEALGLLDRALELEPEYGDAWLNRAVVHLRRGELDPARAALRAAARDRAAAPRALRELGALELQSDRAGDAVRALELLLELLPDDVDALNALGEALRRTGQFEKAAARWRRSLELQPEQPAVRRRLDQL